MARYTTGQSDGSYRSMESHKRKNTTRMFVNEAPPKTHPYINQVGTRRWTMLGLTLRLTAVAKKVRSTLYPMPHGLIGTR